VPRRKWGQTSIPDSASESTVEDFSDKKLYAHGIALAGNVENTAIAGSGNFKLPVPKWPSDPPTHSFLDGSTVAVFDTGKDSCEQIDIPDAAARAFRDDKGTVHLIASHYVTRAGLGPTLVIRQRRHGYGCRHRRHSEPSLRT